MQILNLPHSTILSLCLTIFLSYFYPILRFPNHIFLYLFISFVLHTFYIFYFFYLVFTTIFQFYFYIFYLQFLRKISITMIIISLSNFNSTPLPLSIKSSTSCSTTRKRIDPMEAKPKPLTQLKELMKTNPDVGIQLISTTTIFRFLTCCCPTCCWKLHLKRRRNANTLPSRAQNF